MYSCWEHYLVQARHEGLRGAAQHRPAGQVRQGRVLRRPRTPPAQPRRLARAWQRLTAARSVRHPSAAA
jgi:hypothetical protein